MEKGLKELRGFIEGATLSTGQTLWSSRNWSMDQTVHMERPMAQVTYVTDVDLLDNSRGRGPWA